MLSQHKGFLYKKYSSLDSILTRYCKGTVFALGYYFPDNLAETWTNRIIQFKDNNQLAVNGWTELLHHRITSNNLITQPTLISSIIPSKMTELVPDHPLYKLGSSLAERLSLPWLPDLLQQTPHESLHKTTGPNAGQERDKIIANSYTSRVLDREYDSYRILLLDDVFTRGSTILDATRAIVVANSGMDILTHGLTLGKSENLWYWSQYGIDLENNHYTGEDEDLWNSIGAVHE